MTSIRKNYTAQFKVKVALAMIKGEQTITQICSHFGIHPTQARRWKDKAVEGLEVIFSDSIKNELTKKNELIERLYAQIGQLKVETDWLKKKMGFIG